MLENSIDNSEVRLRLACVPLQKVVVHLQLIGVLAALVWHELGVLLQDIADNEEELVNAEREGHLVCVSGRAVCHPAPAESVFWGGTGGLA